MRWTWSVILLIVCTLGCQHQHPTGVWGGEPTKRVSRILEEYQRPDLPDDIFILEIAHFGGGGDDEVIQLTSRDAKTELRLYEDPPFAQQRSERYYRRDLSKAETAEVRAFLAQNDIAHMQDVEFGGYDGVDYTWTHLVRGFGRTVHVNNPEEDSPCDRLVSYLRTLADTQRMSVVYPKGLEPGLELLFGQHERPIDRVWASGDDVRVKMGGWGEDVGTWMRLNKGELTPSDVPPGFEENDSESVNWQAYGVYGYWDHAPALDRIRYQDGYIRGTRDGTFLCRENRKPERLLDQSISDQLVTPSGKLVGTIEGRLVIYDLEKRAFIPISKAAAAINSFAYRYVPEQKRVLVMQHKVTAKGLRGTDWRLLDPESGLSRVCYLGWLEDMDAEGSMIPSRRAPGSYWVALPNMSADTPATSIMRLNTATMRLESWGHFPVKGISFATRGLWMDEPSGFAYCVYKGHLFRIRIPEKAYEPTRDDAMRSPEPKDE